MIKIAYVIDWIYSPYGGTERQLLMLLNGLNRKLFLPHLIYLRDTDYLSNTKFDFPLTKIPIKKLFSIDFTRGMRIFGELQKQEKFDIVQTFFNDSNVFGTLAAHIAGCKKIISSRRNIGYWHNRSNVVILRFLRRWTDHYLTNSQAAANKTVHTEKVSPDRITIIKNGLEIEKFKQSLKNRIQQRSEWGLDDSHTIIGVVANIRPLKNIESLIASAEELVPEFDKIRFVWVGWGSREPYIELVKTKGLARHFLFPGPTSEVAKCLNAFDIGVLCSKSESLSNSLIEYMAAGLPIVASKVGGNSEAITHGQTGMLYSIDKPEELTKYLLLLLSDQSLAKSLGNKARLVAESFYDKKIMLKHHENFYKRILTAR